MEQVDIQLAVKNLVLMIIVVFNEMRRTIILPEKQK